ncbi:MAG: fibronectin type III domain-containing protein [Lachnospiraceae bacterium]|nr:fibronectin type III domain-containing protein [Lachnospiraceae bacterium]
MKALRKMVSILLITVMSVGLFVSFDGTTVQAASVAAKPGKPVITVSETDGYGEVLISIGKTENADGYRIYYKSNKDTKYNKLTNVEEKGTKKRTYIAKDLKSGTYSFRARAYSKSSGKTVWGSYSSIAKIEVVDASTRARIDRMNEIAGDEYPNLYDMVEEGKLGLTMDDSSNIYFTLGSYDTIDQYENREKKDIEWICLDYDEDNGKALFLSRYILDKHDYNDEYTDVTWENCTLRSWLNETFLYSAFSEKERKELILQTLLINSLNNSKGVNGGNDTKDRVFLLSMEEFNKYAEAIGDTGLLRDGTSVEYYGLRSPGEDSRYMSYVSGGKAYLGRYDPARSGYRCYCAPVSKKQIGTPVIDASYIRPAIWVNMN